MRLSGDGAYIPPCRKVRVLWRRTTIRLYRELATLVGVSESNANAKWQLRLSYMKGR